MVGEVAKGYPSTALTSDFSLTWYEEVANLLRYKNVQPRIASWNRNLFRGGMKFLQALFSYLYVLGITVVVRQLSIRMASMVLPDSKNRSTTSEISYSPLLEG